MQLVTPAIGLMFWTIVIFILLLLILKKFAWKPILKAVDDRNNSIKDALSSAEKAKEEMEQLSADNDKILTEARMERDSIIKEAREIKEKTINATEDRETSNMVLISSDIKFKSNKFLGYMIVQYNI